ncbi:M57 family metalloprotease [Myroides odoratimimus]|uniref:M57 family metalloprotease n=1 Tax=Myroides odoratimimus TaxID=76832 RepID=UPI003101A62F
MRRDIKVNITLTVVNLNNSNLSKTMYNKEQGIIRLNNFEGKADGYRDGLYTKDNITSFEVNYKVVNSLDKVEKNDHVLIIANNVDNDVNSSGDGVGISTTGGRIGAVSSSNIGNNTFDQVAQHELGHNLGLKHSEFKDLMYPKVSGNTSLSNKKKGDIINNQISPTSNSGVSKESSRYKSSSKTEAERFIEIHEIGK